MTRYALMTTKGKEFDDKNSNVYKTENELKTEYERLKEKYNAIENPARETRLGSYGLFKVAEGKCKHGKAVELKYSEKKEETICFSVAPTNR